MIRLTWLSLFVGCAGPLEAPIVDALAAIDLTTQGARADGPTLEARCRAALDELHPSFPALLADLAAAEARFLEAGDLEAVERVGVLRAWTDVRRGALEAAHQRTSDLRGRVTDPELMGLLLLVDAEHLAAKKAPGTEGAYRLVADTARELGSRSGIRWRAFAGMGKHLRDYRRFDDAADAYAEAVREAAQAGDAWPQFTAERGGLVAAAIDALTTAGRIPAAFALADFAGRGGVGLPEAAYDDLGARLGEGEVVVLLRPGALGLHSFWLDAKGARVANAQAEDPLAPWAGPLATARRLYLVTDLDDVVPAAMGHPARGAPIAARIPVVRLASAWALMAPRGEGVTVSTSPKRAPARTLAPRRSLGADAARRLVARFDAAASDPAEAWRQAVAASAQAGDDVWTQFDYWGP